MRRPPGSAEHPRSSLPASASRSIGLDYLRGWIVAAIIACHSLRAYQRFGYVDHERFWLSSGPLVDERRWIGCDAFIAFHDLWVMPLLFFVSALFVWPALRRQGRAAFLRQRLWRLGLPFLAAVGLVMPVAYYPVFLAAGGAGIGDYLRVTALSGWWPSGPAWFNWMLLAFAVLAALLVSPARRGGGARDPIASRLARRPGIFFALLAVGATLAYVPLRLSVGVTDWFAIGPFAAQSCTVLLYAVYYLAGVGLGAAGLEPGTMAPNGWLVAHWREWALAAAIASAAVVLMQLDRLEGSVWPAAAWEPAYAVLFALAGLAIGFAFAAAFLRISRPCPVFDSLCRNAYGMYLIHFLFVTWTQYALLDVDLAAPLKAALVFPVALGGSWASVAALRRIPAVARVL